MDLQQYFENTEGTGILATSDESGRVDMAVYTKPHVADSETIALVMKERLSHKNLTKNLHAAYLFLARGLGYKGIRLYLTMLQEEINQSLIEAMRQKQPEMFPKNDDSHKFIVFFHIDKIRPLVGDYPADAGDLPGSV